MIKAKSKKTNKILKHYQVYSFVVRRNVKLNEPQFWEDTLTPDKLVMHAHYILKAHNNYYIHHRFENRKKRGIPIKYVRDKKENDLEDGT